MAAGRSPGFVHHKRKEYRRKAASQLRLASQVAFYSKQNFGQFSIRPVVLGGIRGSSDSSQPIRKRPRTTNHNDIGLTSLDTSYSLGNEGSKVYLL